MSVHDKNQNRKNNTLQLPRVVFWNNMPAPYVVGRFNALARRGNVEFQAWFMEEREADRSWDVAPETWEFDARYVSPFSILGKILRVPVQELADFQPDLMVSLYESLDFVLGVCIARAKGVKTAFRCLPTFDAWVPRTPTREIAKNVMFRGVDGIFSSGVDGDHYAQRYGALREREFREVQSVNMNALCLSQASREPARAAIRANLDINGPCFLYVGRLWDGKGVRYLLEAFQNIKAVLPGAHLILAGDGVDETMYQAMVGPDPAVHFTGFLGEELLGRYYAAADVFVFPTLGDPHGHAIEEAMCSGLPVLISDACGDAHLRVRDGIEGFVTPRADVQALFSRMLQLGLDPELCRRLGENGRHVAASVTHEQWAIAFERFVGAMMELPRRRNPYSFALGMTGKVFSGLSSSALRGE